MGIPALQLQQQLFWGLCVTHSRLPVTSKHSWGWALNRSLDIFSLTASSSQIANASASPRIDCAGMPTWLVYPFQEKDDLHCEIFFFVKAEEVQNKETESLFVTCRWGHWKLSGNHIKDQIWCCFFIFWTIKDSYDFFKWDRMRYLSIVSVLTTVDGGRHAPCLEKQQE